MTSLISVSDVAKMLGVNRNFIYKLIKDGELTAYKVGATKLRLKEVDDWIEKQKIR